MWSGVFMECLAEVAKGLKLRGVCKFGKSCQRVKETLLHRGGRFLLFLLNEYFYELNPRKNPVLNIVFELNPRKKTVLNIFFELNPRKKTVLNIFFELNPRKNPVLNNIFELNLFRNTKMNNFLN